jgi:hypothetical protein
LRRDDLAKGFVQEFEADPRLVGPLMEDYRCLASALAEILQACEEADADTRIRAILDRPEPHSKWDRMDKG